MSNHEDAVFVRNFSLVLVGLCVVGVGAFILAKIVNRGAQEGQTPNETVYSRIAPVGQINTSDAAIALEAAPAILEEEAAAPPEPVEAAGSAATPTQTADIGEQTYKGACFACHAQGIAGAPKYADVGAWEARLTKGRDALVANAINGYTGEQGMMPARGGNPTLSDEEVAAAVDYMLAAVGGGSEAAAPAAAAPAAAEPAAAEEAAAAEETAAAEEPATAEAAVTTADTGRGKEVYDAACYVCHTPGAAGAPKLGDAANWGPRIEQGMETLYSHSLNGFMGNAGMMPPKGGRPDFSDDDVKAAVDYMVSQAQ
ncbi:MAG: c-type cytochrome [Gammaproteobacteria bacterium]